MVQAEYEFDRDPIESCWVDAGSYCGTNGVLARDAFVADGTIAMQEINQEFQDRLDPLWLDNGGHAHSSVSEAINIYRTYNYCLQQLCDTIRTDCGSGFANSTDENNYNQCDGRRQDLLKLAQSQIKSSLTGNFNRKQRSLWIEKLNAIGLRFDQFLHPRIRQVNRELASAADSILALARTLR